MLPTEELSCGWETSVQQTVTKDRSLAVTGLSFRLKFYFLLFKNNFIEIILQSSIEKSYCIQEGLSILPGHIDRARKCQNSGHRLEEFLQIHRDLIYESLMTTAQGLHIYLSKASDLHEF